MCAAIPEPYAALRGAFRRIGLLQSLDWLLQWDQETYMPAGGVAGRAEQSALAAELRHAELTSPRVGELLDRCEADTSLTGDPESETAANIREMRRDYTLATKVPADLVAAIARTCSAAQSTWREAREKNDFKGFAPVLDEIFGLMRHKADCLGWGQGGERYDAVLDLYEPGMTSRMVETAFSPLRDHLSDLIADVRGGKAPSTKVLEGTIDPARQHAFSMKILTAIGFDFSGGRLDTTTHPFCTGVGPGDVRLTTRYNPRRFTAALYGCMHEAGHGMYEQGLPQRSQFGEPLAEAVSLGIHESQSRMWENFVGRSKAFWAFALPHARKMLGGLGRATPDTLYRAVNVVQPSFIRVEADETTYNLHVMLRFELERALLRGDLNVRDIPGAWNERMRTSLGVKVPDDRRGCMQDIHWSAGLIGYFPTYTLGNLYAAQMWEKIVADIPKLNAQISRGKFGELKSWLAEHVHKHGRRYRAPDLARRISGRPLEHEPLMRYLRGKAEEVYGIGGATAKRKTASR